MRINDDFSRPIIVHAGSMPWVRSPAPGVERRMLFRIGDEIARATSIVRYAEGSAFPRHTHGGGEEFIVLNGVFQDEHGDYPEGTYVRNPTGTSHVPASKEGCTIFVRLWQFRASDHTPVVLGPDEGRVISPRPGARDAKVLFDDGHETVRVEEWSNGKTVSVDNPVGLEYFILSGSVRVGSETLEPLSWGRLPPGVVLNATVGPHDARIWLKQAPLLHTDICQLPQPIGRGQV